MHNKNIKTEVYLFYNHVYFRDTVTIKITINAIATVIVTIIVTIIVTVVITVIVTVVTVIIIVIVYFMTDHVLKVCKITIQLFRNHWFIIH